MRGNPEIYLLAAEFDALYEDALTKLIGIYGETSRPAFAHYDIKANFKPAKRRD